MPWNREDQEPRPLFVKELIRRVHQELKDSKTERERSGEPPIFEVERMTIEVNFVAIESKEAKGGLSFKIITVGGVDLGGGASYQHQQVHKMTLSLSAISYGGDLQDLELPDSPSRFMPRDEDEA
jgi:hypothetical protein